MVMVVCPNEECRRLTLKASLYQVERASVMGGVEWRNMRPVAQWRLIPPSPAKVFPSYVPQPIRDDYEEACKIRDLSPKASATLSRRCLQGMIRDFWGIKEKRLIDEIEALKGKIEGDTWDAIDAIRKVGNIGAHMEKDINVIIDVEPEEAQLLIELIEMLIREWYINRHQRQERLKAIVAVKDAKDTAKGAGSATIP